MSSERSARTCLSIVKCIFSLNLPTRAPLLPVFRQLTNVWLRIVSNSQGTTIEFNIFPRRFFASSTFQCFSAIAKAASTATPGFNKLAITYYEPSYHLKNSAISHVDTWNVLKTRWPNRQTLTSLVLYYFN